MRMENWNQFAIATATSQNFDTIPQIVPNCSSIRWGLETRFAYAGNHLETITDPAGRITRLEYDEAGNMIRIIDPDETVRTFEYDERHRMTAEIDKRGNREEVRFNFAGRVTDAIRKDGTRVQFNTVQSHGLFPPELTLDPTSAPIAISPDSAVAYSQDSNGNVMVTELDALAQAVNARDSVGPLPHVERDSNNTIW